MSSSRSAPTAAPVIPTTSRRARRPSEAIRAMTRPPRLLHARFPMRGPILVDAIVELAHVQPGAVRRNGGVRARLQVVHRRHIDARRRRRSLACRVVSRRIVHHRTGRTGDRAVLHPLRVGGHRCGRRRWGHAATGARTAPAASWARTAWRRSRPRNAHVIAHDDVTCLVLAPTPPSRVGGRGPDATAGDCLPRRSVPPAPRSIERGFSVDVTPTLERKVAALAAHRSQYAMDPDLLPRSMLERLLGTEHFVVASARNG